MTEASDTRVPVVFGAPGQAGTADALVLDAGAPDVVAQGAAGARAATVLRISPRRPGHGFGCACCAPRGAVAEAFGRLFVARARGEVAFFRRVVVSAEGAPPFRAAVEAAVREDRLVAGRYRLASSVGNL